MTTNALYFADLQVGDRWVTRRRTVTETDIVQFAASTGDFDPLHVDHEFARRTPFGGPIAHGLLGLAWLSGLGSTAPPVRTMAFSAIRNWEFLKPIYAGDTLYAVNEVISKEEAGRRAGRVVWSRRLMNQADEVVQEGTFETLVYHAEPPALRHDQPQQPSAPKTNAPTPSPQGDA